MEGVPGADNEAGTSLTLAGSPRSLIWRRGARNPSSLSQRPPRDTTGRESEMSQCRSLLPVVEGTALAEEKRGMSKDKMRPQKPSSTDGGDVVGSQGERRQP